MTAAKCLQPPPIEDLLSYAQRELGEQRASEIEEHFFACAACARRLSILQALGAGIARLVERGQLAAGASVALLERARKSGLRMGEYRLEPGQSAQCTIRPEHDFNALRLAASFSGVEHVDVECRPVTGKGPDFRFEDVAIDREHGEIVLLFPGDMLRPLPASTLAIELRGRGSGGERKLASYALHHSPWS